jgi:hypothetical protein
MVAAANNFYGIMNQSCDVHFGLVCFSNNAGTSVTSVTAPNDGKYGPNAITDEYGYGSVPEAAGVMPSGPWFPYEPILIANPAVPLNPLPTSAAINYTAQTTPPTSPVGPVYSNFYSGNTYTPQANVTTTVNGSLFNTNAGIPTPPANPASAAQNLYTYIYTVGAYGGTNIADALDEALSMMFGPNHPGDPTTTPGCLGGSYNNGAPRPALNLSRPGATRAIILFTDGLPNGGGDSMTQNGTSINVSWTYSQAEAKAANSAGIPIYTIGLCEVPIEQTYQTNVLTDAKGTNGIAALSANGATFAQTTSSSGLTALFQNVARQLVQLVQ